MSSDINANDSAKIENRLYYSRSTTDYRKRVHFPRNTLEFSPYAETYSQLFPMHNIPTSFPSTIWIFLVLTSDKRTKRKSYCSVKQFCALHNVHPHLFGYFCKMKRNATNHFSVALTIPLRTIFRDASTFYYTRTERPSFCYLKKNNNTYFSIPTVSRRHTGEDVGVDVNDVIVCMEYVRAHSPV